MTVEIPLTKGFVAIVDDEDGDLAKFKWMVCQRARRSYAKRSIYPQDGHKTTAYLHRIVLGRFFDRTLNSVELVDHINHNGLDNRRCNLRLSTPSKNTANSRLAKNNTSGMKGVSWNQLMKKWEVSICFNGEKQKLGFFASITDAAEAYDRKAIEFWGEHAFVNVLEKV